MKLITIILMALLLTALSGCVDMETKETSPETKTQMVYKHPDIHLAHEYYLKGTNITTLEISQDTMFFNNGMRTTDYMEFYIYEIPNASTSKYYVHTTTVDYIIESVLIGDNTETRTVQTVHLFLPRPVMEKIVKHQMKLQFSLSGISRMVWTSEQSVETN